MRHAVSFLHVFYLLFGGVEPQHFLACLSEKLLKFFVDYHNSCWFIFWSTDWSIMRLNTAALQHNKSKDNPACNEVPVICLLHLYSWFCMFVCCGFFFFFMCLTMKCCSGRRAGLCGGRALGARVKGWLSEALVQERTETWNIITVTWLLNKHIFKLHLKIWFITYHECLNENIFYYVTPFTFIIHYFWLTCLFPPCYRLCGCWICWLFL